MSAPDIHFMPPAGLRSAHVQSFLNSSGLRQRAVKKRSGKLEAAEQEWLLDGGDGVRLQAHYSAQPGDSRGLAVLFHGWEGSSRSNYMLGTGARLLDAGFDVFRLNFRDHGDTHHLNEGIFHSCRLDEVVNALADMQARLNARDWHLAGYSLGGNFTLRVALRAPGAGLSIANTVAVCPVICPANTLTAMENAPRIYERYYIRKWARSLRKKEAVYPDYCDWETWHALPGLRERTRYLATHRYDFDSLEAYLDGYSIARDRLSGLAVPSLVLTAADDPVIPVSDFDELEPGPNLEVHIADHGGHCGFLKNWGFESWAEDVIQGRFLGEDAFAATTPEEHAG